MILIYLIWIFSTAMAPETIYHWLFQNKPSAVFLLWARTKITSFNNVTKSFWIWKWEYNEIKKKVKQQNNDVQHGARLLGPCASSGSYVIHPSFSAFTLTYAIIQVPFKTIMISLYTGIAFSKLGRAHTSSHFIHLHAFYDVNT